MKSVAADPILLSDPLSRLMYSTGSFYQRSSWTGVLWKDLIIKLRIRDSKIGFRVSLSFLSLRLAVRYFINATVSSLGIGISIDLFKVAMMLLRIG